MLIEKTLEQTIADALGALSPLSSACIIPFRGSTAAGVVKGTADTDAPVIVSVALGLRQHDGFTLPTVNIPGTVTVVTRAELCPTGAEHEAAVEAIADRFTSWHLEGVDMSAALSISGRFYAAELRMDGGSGKDYDTTRSAWTETISFTIRGTILD